MSKKAIHQNDPEAKNGMTMGFFGTLETCLFFSYSIFQFCSGSIGDNFNKKTVLVISFII